MIIEELKLWDEIPGMCETPPDFTAYIPKNKKSDGAVVIFPGGGYHHCAVHEGKGYAEFLCSLGICAFVLNYRLMPHYFPLPLLDARRAVQYVRYNAKNYGIDPQKVAVMGSSAGGHLAALVSTYTDDISEYKQTDDISKCSFLPDAQILCYPVIQLWGKESAHVGVGKNFLGDMQEKYADTLNADNIVKDETPKAFIWTTFEDSTVDPQNSLDYARALNSKGIHTELHIYPQGRHGLGIPTGDDEVSLHVKLWSDALAAWLDFIGF